MGFRDFVRLAREVLTLGVPQAEPSEALMRQADEIAASAKQLLATSETLLGSRAETTATAPAGEATHEEIEQRIEQIYGARRTSEGGSAPDRSAEASNSVSPPVSVRRSFHFIPRTCYI